MLGIWLSLRRLGSRRSDQSYASNQHRRGNGFNHRHLSDLQFCTYSPPHEQSYYPPTREWSPELSSGGQLKQSGAMSDPRARTNASCQYLSAMMLLHLFYYLFFKHFSHRGPLLLEFPESNDETSLRFSPSFHGPYNLCGSCRQWFA